MGKRNGMHQSEANFRDLALITLEISIHSNLSHHYFPLTDERLSVHRHA